MVYDLIVLLLGLVALTSVAGPLLLRDRLVTYPMVLVGLGALLAWAVFAPGQFDPVERGGLIERLSEFASSSR